MEYFIIVNPQAGAGRTGKRWTQISAELNRQGIPFRHAFTHSKEHVRDLVLEAVELGYKYIAAVGGDGTVYDVLNGMMNQQVVPVSDLTLAVIPSGTGNDWLKTYKLSGDYRKMIAAMKENRTRPHDVGMITCMRHKKQVTRYFLNVAGMAYDAFVTKISNHTKRPPWMPSKVYYFSLIFKCLHQFKPAPMRVEFNDQVMEGRFFSVNAGICSFNGGGANFCPQAIPDDGLLALTIVGEVSKVEIIKNTNLIYNGKIHNHPEINGYQTPRVKLTALDPDQPILIEADGEYLGESPIEIENLYHEIRIVV